MAPSRPTLHVCVTCGSTRDGAAPAGELLHAALAARCPDWLAVAPVKCLASCDRGCMAAVTAPGKWGYLVGGLDPAMAADVIAYAQAYDASASGAVLPSRRPASLARAVVARIPATPEPLAVPAPVPEVA